MSDSESDSSTLSGSDKDIKDQLDTLSRELKRKNESETEESISLDSGEWQDQLTDQKLNYSSENNYRLSFDTLDTGVPISSSPNTSHVQAQISKFNTKSHSACGVKKDLKPKQSTLNVTRSTRANSNIDEDQIPDLESVDSSLRRFKYVKMAEQEAADEDRYIKLRKIFEAFRIPLENRLLAITSDCGKTVKG